MVAMIENLNQGQTFVCFSFQRYSMVANFDKVFYCHTDQTKIALTPNYSY